MKKIVKLLALALCLTIICTSFFACSKTEQTKEKGKFTYWTNLFVTASQTVTNYNELLMYQEIQKATGVEIDFIHPAQGTSGEEAFQILLASGDYPDMIEYGWDSYAGGPDAAIADGVIINLNDYLKDYAPNYYDYMEGEKGKQNGGLYKAQSLSAEGNYYGFRSLQVGSYRGFNGLYVRKDLLDKWGLEIPVTIDDWDEVFATAKKNGIKYPFTGAVSNYGPFSGRFGTAWNVIDDFYIDGDEVKFGPFESEFKDYIAKMAEWVKKGYIDIDYITNDSTIIIGRICNGESIASSGYIGSAFGKILPAMAERDPEFSIVACPAPVMKEGDKAWFQELQAEARDSTLCITVDCGEEDDSRYIDAVKWCDYLYSDEGAILKSFGVEGDTFTIEKGEDGKDHYVYTDKITKNYESIGAHSVDAAMWHFMLPANAPGINQHEDYLQGMYSYQQQKDALETYNLYVDEAKKHVMPPLRYTTEEATIKANAEAKNKDNLTAAISNIIIGKANISTLDDAIAKAKKGGYDELLKVQQDAYDRYLKVLNS